MKTLHGYLTRQVLTTLAMTVLVFTFVLLLGNVLKEILALLVNRQVTFSVVLHALVLLIPFVLVFALPMGLLTATLLVFGRFSADQELTAVRANGISLLGLVTPILLLSVALSGVCAWFNLMLAPAGRVAYKDLLQRWGREQPLALLTPGRFVSDFKGYLIYVGKIRGPELEDILIAELDGQQVVRRFRAAQGRLSAGASKQEFRLDMTQGWAIELNTNNGTWQPAIFAEAPPLTITTDAGAERRNATAYSDMTFSELWSEKRALERLSFQTRPVRPLSPEALRDELKLSSRMRTETLMPVLVQLHRQAAFSFACIGFTLVGIPLGIKAHRRETSIGVGIALLLVLAYYSFIVLAQSLDTRADLAPHLIVWLPNFIFQAVGAVLLWRTNQGR